MMANVVNRFVDQFVKFGLGNILQPCGRLINPFLQAVYQCGSCGSSGRLVRLIGHHADVLSRLQWPAQ